MVERWPSFLPIAAREDSSRLALWHDINRFAGKKMFGYKLSTRVRKLGVGDLEGPRYQLDFEALRRPRTRRTLPLSENRYRTMTEDEFKTWSREKGIPDDAVSTILQVARVPLKKKTVRTDCLFAPADIYDLFSTDGYRVNPQQSGFIFIGCTPNGDPIAIDVADDCGSVWYVDHEKMHENDLRRCAIRIAENLASAYLAISTDRTFPIDYYSAKKRQIPNDQP